MINNTYKSKLRAKRTASLKRKLQAINKLKNLNRALKHCEPTSLHLSKKLRERVFKYFDLCNHKNECDVL